MKGDNPQQGARESSLSLADIERLRAIMKAAVDGDPRTLAPKAEKYGFSDSTVRGFIAGKSNDIQYRTLAAFWRAYDLDANDLLSITNDNAVGSEIKAALRETGRTLRTAKFLGKVQGGIFREGIELPEDEQREIPVLVDLEPEYGALPLFALEVVGTSMNLLYPEGTYVVCVRSFDLGEGWKPEPGDRVIVRATTKWGHKTEQTIKEVEIDRDGTVWLKPRSTDPEFQTPYRFEPRDGANGDFDEHSDSIVVTGLVVGSWRDERRRRH